MTILFWCEAPIPQPEAFKGYYFQIPQVLGKVKLGGTIYLANA